MCARRVGHCYLKSYITIYNYACSYLREFNQGAWLINCCSDPFCFLLNVLVLSSGWYFYHCAFSRTCLHLLSPQLWGRLELFLRLLSLLLDTSTGATHQVANFTKVCVLQLEGTSVAGMMMSSQLFDVTNLLLLFRCDDLTRVTDSSYKHNNAMSALRSIV